MMSNQEEQSVETLSRRVLGTLMADTFPNHDHDSPK